jgi:NCAIR mutase (PurE)-related protein
MLTERPSSVAEACGGDVQGLTPLLSALTASSPGVSVVNIDNGFGAGMLAARILRTAAKLRAQAAAATAVSSYPHAS